MAIDREQLETMFNDLERALNQRTRLCIFGSTPGILSGQPNRQTKDVDVWNPKSNYDVSDLRRACWELGIPCNPTTQEQRSSAPMYFELVPRGIVSFPLQFETAPIFKTGKLIIEMPTPVLLSASKLVRASMNDLTDVCWWIQERSITLRQVDQAIRRLPVRYDRETAHENLALVQVLLGQQQQSPKP